MAKKTTRTGRKRKAATVKDLKAGRGGVAMGGTYFNPKEITIDKNVPWQRKGS
jgi:hypothetical protein